MKVKTLSSVQSVQPYMILDSGADPEFLIGIRAREHCDRAEGEYNEYWYCQTVF